LQQRIPQQGAVPPQGVINQGGAGQNQAALNQVQPPQAELPSQGLAGQSGPNQGANLNSLSPNQGANLNSLSPNQEANLNSLTPNEGGSNFLGPPGAGFIPGSGTFQPGVFLTPRGDVFVAQPVSQRFVQGLGNLRQQFQQSNGRRFRGFDD
jgi:hypothetical protein